MCSISPYCFQYFAYITYLIGLFICQKQTDNPTWLILPTNITGMYVPEISNKYLKRWADSSHTYNFWYLYALIHVLILYSHYSYSNFEVLIVLVLNNTHDVFEFDSPWIDIYKNHIICMNCIRALKYSREGCAFTLLAVFVFFFLLSLKMQEQLRL